MSFAKRIFDEQADEFEVPMTAGSAFLVDFYQQLRRSWSIETSSRWQPGNPASGQCGVTALVVHDKSAATSEDDVNGAGLATIASMESASTHDEVNSTATWLRRGPSSRNEALGDAPAEIDC